MLVVHVVEREHGAAGQKELGGERLEAQRLQWNAEGGIGIARQKRWSKEAEDDKKAEEMAEPRGRDDGDGNRHGCVDVSLLLE
jgi:hypothetical protein